MTIRETMRDAIFITGLSGIGFGIYDLAGRSWAVIAVSTILLAISLVGATHRDS